MSTTSTERRDFQWLERRRKRAARLFAAGEIQAVVARALAVSRQSVSRWYSHWRKGGPASLKASGRAGRMPRLDRKELGRIDVALRKGAHAHGFNTDLWTLPRVAKVIKDVSGVSYHPGHVWKVLRSMNWTLQRPAKKAKERNDDAIRRWVKETWPALKKTPVDRRPGLSSRMKVESRSDLQSGRRGRREVKLQS
ncbi:MAG: winged helix-turn-helix domain-containing protein [Thermodesulfobacteriota bacterium]